LHWYLPTFVHFVASKVKNDAKSFANGNADKEVKYLDSIGKEKYLILVLLILLLR
jgi:hypothetical protein